MAVPRYVLGLIAFATIVGVGLSTAAVQPTVATWPLPSLAMVRGTVFGPLDAELFLKARKPENSAERYYDAVLYLGRSTSLWNLAP